MATQSVYLPKVVEEWVRARGELRNVSLSAAVVEVLRDRMAAESEQRVRGSAFNGLSSEEVGVDRTS